MEKIKYFKKSLKPPHGTTPIRCQEDARPSSYVLPVMSFYIGQEYSGPLVVCLESSFSHSYTDCLAVAETAEVINWMLLVGWFLNVRSQSHGNMKEVCVKRLFSFRLKQISNNDSRNMIIINR